MEKERVRERRRGQEWRDRYKQEMDGFNRTDEESTVRTVGKEKKYRTGKKLQPFQGDSQQPNVGRDSFWSFSEESHSGIGHFHLPFPFNQE